MSDYTYGFGGLADGHDVPERFALKTLTYLPAMPAAKRAVDSAGARRKGVLLLGPGGAGKSAASRAARDWYNGIQRKKAEKDSNYRRQRLVTVFSGRGSGYWDTAVKLARQLDRRYTEKVRGRKKDQNEVRRDLIEMALNTGTTLLVVDDAEKSSEEELLFFRDVMAESEEMDLSRRGGDNGQSAAGVGIVLVGHPDLIGRSPVKGELGRRWSQRIDVRQIRPEECGGIYRDWLPGLTPYIRRLGEESWTNYVSSLLRPLKGTLSVGFLETHTRLYVLKYARHHRDIPEVGGIDFDEHLFEKAFHEAWVVAE